MVFCSLASHICSFYTLVRSASYGLFNIRDFRSLLGLAAEILGTRSRYEIVGRG